MKLKPQIYKTTNTVNGKYYIGKTMGGYSWYKGSGVALNRAFKKYGKNNFSKEVLEFCSSHTLNEREKFWISKYNAVEDPQSYNMVEGGEGVASNLLKVPVYQYNLKGDFIKKYNCISEAAEELNIHYTGISMCLNPKKYSKSAGGYQWKLEYFENIEPYKKNKGGRKSIKEGKNHYEKYSKDYYSKPENLEKRKQYDREYKRKNKEYSQKYYKENKDKILKTQKEKYHSKKMYVK